MSGVGALSLDENEPSESGTGAGRTFDSPLTPDLLIMTDDLAQDNACLLRYCFKYVNRSRDGDFGRESDRPALPSRETGSLCCRRPSVHSAELDEPALEVQPERLRDGDVRPRDPCPSPRDRLRLPASVR